MPHNHHSLEANGTKLDTSVCHEEGVHADAPNPVKSRCQMFGGLFFAGTVCRFSSQKCKSHKTVNAFFLFI